MKHTKTKKTKQNQLAEICGTISRSKIMCSWSPCRKVRGKGGQKISEEKIAKNFPNLTKTKIHRSKKFNKLQTQKSQRKLQYITIKVKTSDKEEILKIARKKGKYFIYEDSRLLIRNNISQKTAECHL